MVGATLICGGLFALYHQNPAQTLYQFCCGVAFALITIRSGSILPTVLSHFLNNAFILTLAKFGVESFPPMIGLVLLAVSLLCLIASLVWLFIFDKRKGDKQEQNNTIDTKEQKRFFIYASVGFAICLLTWIAVFISGL